MHWIFGVTFDCKIAIQTTVVPMCQKYSKGKPTFNTISYLPRKPLKMGTFDLWRNSWNLDDNEMSHSIEKKLQNICVKVHLLTLTPGKGFSRNIKIYYHFLVDKPFRLEQIYANKILLSKKQDQTLLILKKNPVIIQTIAKKDSKNKTATKKAFMDSKKKVMGWTIGDW